MNSEKLWTRNFISISASTLFLFLTFYCLLVILPLYTLEDLHGQATDAGLVVTVFLLAAILIRPIAGQWLNRIEQRSLLLLSLFLFLIADLFYFFTHSITSLLILRFMHGISFGIVTTVCGTIVADLIPNSRKGEGMGYYAMAMNLAMVIGPFVGLTTFYKWGATTSFIISSIFALFALILGGSLRLPKEQQTAATKTQAAFHIKQLFEVSAVRISLTAAFFSFVYASILSFVSVYAKEIGLEKASSYFFVVYAAVMLLSRPFTGKLFDKRGANVIIYPAIVFFAIGMLLLSLAHTTLLFLLSAACIGLGWGTLFPCFQTIAVQNAAPKRRGVATATFLSIFDSGIGLGSFVIGLAAVHIHLSSLYLYCSLLVLIGVAVYYTLNGNHASAPVRSKHHRHEKSSGQHNQAV